VKRCFEGQVLFSGCSSFGGDPANWGTVRNFMLRDWYWLFGAGGGGNSAEWYSTKSYVVGLTLVIGSSRCGGESAEWGQRNGMLRECYWLM